MMDNETFKRIYNDALINKDTVALQQIINQRMIELGQRINIDAITEFDVCALAVIHKNQYETLINTINANPKMQKMYRGICRTTSIVSFIMPDEKKENK